MRHGHLPRDDLFHVVNPQNMFTIIDRKGGNHGDEVE